MRTRSVSTLWWWLLIGAAGLAALVLIAVYTAAITSGGTAGSPSTPSAPEFVTGWPQFMADAGTWAQTDGIGLVWLVVGFVVIVRLLALLPVWNWGRSSLFGNRASFGLGLAFILVAGLALASLTPLWYLAVGIGLAGCVLLAAYTAQRMVLRVEVRSTDGNPDVGGTAQLSAYVAALGTESLQGRWLPRASDAPPGLQASDFVGLSTNAFVSAILGLVQRITGTAQWRAVVFAAKDGSLGVEITRNRQSIETVSVDRSILQLPSSPDAAGKVGTVGSDLYRMAAAVIVMRVSEKYSGFDGLYGATKWESLGRHFIATTEAAEDRPRAIGLLERAVFDDPQNRLSALALERLQHRYATDAAEIQRYIRWLLEQYDDIRSEQQGYGPLRYRLLLNYLTAVCNLRSLPGHAKDEQRAGTLSHQLLASLHNDSSSLAESIRPLAAVARWRLLSDAADTASTESSVVNPQHSIQWRADEWQGGNWLELANKNADPHVKYALACYYAQRQPPQVEASVSLLADALAAPDLQYWAVHDPALRPLHTSARFAALVGKEPRTTWLAVPPFAKHRAQCEEIGIAQPAQLITAQMSTTLVPRAPGVALAEYLGVGALEVTALVRAAALCIAIDAQAVEFGDLGDFRYELTSELLAQGISEVHQVIMMDPYGREDLAARVSTAIAARCVGGPDSDTVLGWLEQFFLDIDIL